MIKNIIFDFGDVLVQDRTKDPNFIKLIEKLPKRLQKLSHNLALKSEVGKINFSKLQQFDKKYLFPDKSEKEIEYYFLKTKVLPAWKLAHKLSKNYKIIIFSNHHKGLPERTGKLLGINVHDFPFVNSALVGMRKPQLQFYRYLLKHFKLIPSQTLFIDDRERNLIPARKLGIKTFHYEQNIRDLIKFLKGSGVVVK